MNTELYHYSVEDQYSQTNIGAEALHRKNIVALPPFEDVYVPPSVRPRNAIEQRHESMGKQKELHAKEIKTFKTIEFSAHEVHQHSKKPIAHESTRVHLLSNQSSSSVSVMLVTCLSVGVFILQTVL